MADQHIFVSYSRLDAELVLKLSTDLRQAGANLWLDQLDIAAGSTWDIEIEKALEACDCLLFIVSQSSVNSNNVLNEVYYALEERKRVLPVKINDCKIPFRIKRLQYIDLSVNYNEGFRHLLKAMNLESKQKAIEEIKSDPENKLLPEATDKEEEIWQQAKNENSKAGYQKYLKEFPEGKHKADALHAIDTIDKEEEKKARVEKEENLWSAALNSHTISSYQNYIKNSYLRTHAEEARIAIAKIENKAKEDTENRIWLEATQINSTKAYLDYLQQYASGKYAEIAKAKIKKLEEFNEESLWEEAKKANTIASFQNYLKHTSLKQYIEDAERLIKEIEKNGTKSNRQELRDDNKIKLEKRLLQEKRIGKDIIKIALIIGVTIILMFFLFKIINAGNSDNSPSNLDLSRGDSVQTSIDSNGMAPFDSTSKMEKPSVDSMAKAYKY